MTLWESVREIDVLEVCSTKTIILPSCTGIWTVYYKSSRGNTADNNEYHAYLIISLESRTMVTLI